MTLALIQHTQLNRGKDGVPLRIILAKHGVQGRLPGTVARNTVHYPSSRSPPITSLRGTSPPTFFASLETGDCMQIGLCGASPNVTTPPTAIDFKKRLSVTVSKSMLLTPASRKPPVLRNNRQWKQRNGIAVTLGIVAALPFAALPFWPIIYAVFGHDSRVWRTASRWLFSNNSVLSTEPFNYLLLISGLVGLALGSLCARHGYRTGVWAGIVGTILATRLLLPF